MTNGSAAGRARDCSGRVVSAARWATICSIRHRQSPERCVLRSHRPQSHDRSVSDGTDARKERKARGRDGRAGLLPHDSGEFCKLADRFRCGGAKSGELKQKERHAVYVALSGPARWGRGSSLAQGPLRTFALCWAEPPSAWCLSLLDSAACPRDGQLSTDRGQGRAEAIRHVVSCPMSLGVRWCGRRSPSGGNCCAKRYVARGSSALAGHTSKRSSLGP